MTEATLEYGSYTSVSLPDTPATPVGIPDAARAAALEAAFEGVSPVPGVCVPWQMKREEMGSILGDEALVKRVWEDVDSFAYTYIWHCLVSF